MDNLFEFHLSPVNGERLRIARERRGLTQSALADALCIDQTMIAHIERGAKQPNVEMLDALATELGMPARFFRRADPPELPRGTLLFRAKSGIGKRVISKAHSEAQLVFELACGLAEHAKLIPVRLPKITDPIDAARAIRNQLDAPQGPIFNLIRSAEKLGVLVIPIPDSADCDAFATWAGNAREVPVIGMVMNKEPDRARMNVAHELGHLVLHRHIAGGTPLLEVEAYRFAAELLMPASSIIGDLQKEKLNLFRLAKLKTEWQVSMQAIARRGRDLGVLSDRQFRYLMVQMSAKGWRMKEPDFGGLKPERPRAIRKMAEVAFGPELNYEKIANHFGLSVDFITDVMDAFARGSAAAPKQPHNRRKGPADVVIFDRNARD